MPDFDFSGLPDKAQVKSGFDMSGLPDRTPESSTWDKVTGAIQSVRKSPLGRLLTQPIADTIPGGRRVLEEAASPGLHTSKPLAMAQGFVSGALGSVSPLTIAAGASLGTGVPAAIANAALAAEGLGEATDPEATAAQRVGGVANLAGGGAGAATGFWKALRGLRSPTEVPPAPTQVVAPTITQEAGNKVFQVPPPVKPGLAAIPTPQAISAYQESIRGELNKLLRKAPGASTGLEDLDAAIQGANREAATTRAGNFRSEVAAQRGETSADIASIKAQLAEEARTAKQQMKEAADAEAAARIQQTIQDRGLRPGTPSIRLSQSAPTEEGRLSQTTPFRGSRVGREADVVDVSGEPVEPTATAPGVVSLRRPTVSPDWTPSYGEATAKADISAQVPPAAQIPPAPEIISETTPLGRLLKPKQSAGERFNTRVNRIVDRYGLSTKPGAIEPHPEGVTPIEPAVETSQVGVGGVTPAGAAVVPELREALSRVQRSSTATAPLEGPSQAPGAMISSGVGVRPASWDQYPPEVVQELDRLGAQYRGPREERGTAGKEMSEIRDFFTPGKMREAWRGAPNPAVAPELATEPTPVTGPQQAPPAEYGPGREPTAPAADAPEWVKEQNNFLERMKRLNRSESGAVNPALLGRLGATLGGAGVGAPVGAALNPDDPYAGLKGAASGAYLGFAGATGAQSAPAGTSKALAALKELTQYRNAGLIGTKAAQLKKPISDWVSVGQDALTRMTSGDTQRGLEEAKNLFRVPTIAKDVWEGLRVGQIHPELSDVIGDVTSPNRIDPSGPLGIVSRPYSGWTLAAQRAQTRAGIPVSEARKTIYLNEPETGWGKWNMAPQQWRGPLGAIARAVRPFQRIATNWAERNVEHVPGLSLVTGDPTTRVSRTVQGTAATGAGMLQGMYEQAAQDRGEEPETPLQRSLRGTALGRWGLANFLGEGLTGPRGLRDLYWRIPGISQTVPPPGPKETAGSGTLKFLKQWLSNSLPDRINPIPQPDESTTVLR